MSGGTLSSSPRTLDNVTTAPGQWQHSSAFSWLLLVSGLHPEQGPGPAAPVSCLQLGPGYSPTPEVDSDVALVCMLMLIMDVEMPLLMILNYCNNKTNGSDVLLQNSIPLPRVIL